MTSLKLALKEERQEWCKQTEKVFIVENCKGIPQEQGTVSIRCPLILLGACNTGFVEDCAQSLFFS